MKIEYSAAIDTGKQLVDHIVKLSTKMDGRLGDVCMSFIIFSIFKIC